MGVIKCADNTAHKNLSIMTEKGIGGRLNKIAVTSFDVMCVYLKEGIFIHFKDNARVIVNVKGEIKGSPITRPVSQEHPGEVSRQVNMIVMDDRQGKGA